MVNVYTEDQDKWLNEVSGAVSESKNLEGELQDLEAGQALLRDGLASDRGAIRQAFERAEVEMKANGVLEKLKAKMGIAIKKQMLDSRLDDIDQFDTWHHIVNAKEFPPEVIHELKIEFQKIIDVQKKLLELDYYARPEEPDKPKRPEKKQDASKKDEQAYKKELEEYGALIEKYQRDYDEYLEKLEKSNERLARDLWKPLEREGIIPENVIPSAFSEVEATFAAADGYYADRLKEYNKDLRKNAALQEKFSIGVKIVSKLAAVAGESAGLAGNVGDMLKNDSLADSAGEAKEIIELVELAVTTTGTVASSVLKRSDAIGAADKVSEMIGKTIGKIADDEDLGDLIEGVMKTSARSAGIADALSRGNYEGAFEALGAALNSGLSAVDGTDDKILESIGGALETGFKTLAKSLGASKEVKKGNTQEAMKLIYDALGGIVDNALKEAANRAASGKAAKDDAGRTYTEREKNKLDDKRSAEQDARDSASEYLTGVNDEDDDKKDLLEAMSGIKDKLTGKVKQAELEELAEKAAKTERREFEAYLQERDEDYDAKLAYSFADPSGDEEEIAQAELKQVESIEYIIALRKRDEKILELSRKLLTKGPKLLTALFPGPGLVSACAQLAYSIADAIKHARQMIIWHDNVRDARKAKTVQMDAMMNRYGLETKQNIEADIQVAINATAVVGEAMKLAGQAAPIGIVVAGAASTAASVVDLIKTMEEEAKMAMAWSTYRKAIKTPQDRILARQALQDNPTLAKYAMAWGAVVDKNPIAQEGMRRCGLNERTLAQKGAEVDKVVEYLEVVYKEDPQLLRAVASAGDWHPGTVELSLGSWMAFYQAAITKAKPPVKKSDVGKIVAAFHHVKKTSDALEAETNAAIEANKKLTRKEFNKSHKRVRNTTFDTAIGALTELAAALEAYKPSDDSGKPHYEMLEYADCLAARAEGEIPELEALRSARSWYICSEGPVPVH